MATLLFYERPVPLNVDVHLKTRLGSLGANAGFAANTNSIPLAAVEFIDTAREYPIAFTGQEGGALFPIALVGVRQNENLFVTDDNRWDGRYVPAFVRRYPFVLAEKQEADDFNVYLDEAYSGFDAADGERLFTDQGEHTPLLKQALEFLSTYQGEITRTRQFVDRLKSLDLLIPRVLEVVRNSEPPLVLQGFSVVDEQRLADLSDVDLLALARDGYLALIHTHLGSLGNVTRLSERLGARLTPVAPATEETAESAQSSKKKRSNSKEAQSE